MKFAAHVHLSHAHKPIDCDARASFSLALPLGNLTSQQNPVSLVYKAFAVFPGGAEGNIDETQSVSKMSDSDVFCVHSCSKLEKPV